MAKPETGPDGSVNLMVWNCTIPGKAGVSIHNRFVNFILCASVNCEIRVLMSSKFEPFIR